MAKKKDVTLEAIKNTIVEKYRPEKIILFGSRAYGTPTEHSDYDILVIKNTKQRDIERIWEVSKYFLSRDFGLDILVRTPKEIEERLKGGFTLYKEIMQKGKVIYERTK